MTRNACVFASPPHTKCDSIGCAPGSGWYEPPGGPETPDGPEDGLSVSHPTDAAPALRCSSSAVAERGGSATPGTACVTIVPPNPVPILLSQEAFAEITNVRLRSATVVGSGASALASQASTSSRRFAWKFGTTVRLHAS